MSQRIGRRLLAVAAILIAAAAGNGQDTIDFQRQVLPILKSSCLRCHQATQKDPNGRTRRPKGGLRLDGRDWILSGGKHGAAVVPGKPEASLLLTRISLSVEDDDFMPAKGDALTKAQIERIERWIAAGAPFGSWQGAKGPAAAVVEKAQSAAVVTSLSTPMLEVYTALGEGLTPALHAAVQRSAGSKCQIVPVAPKSPLLRVAFVSNEASIGDADLDKLIPLSDHITNLGLGRTKITDAACTRIAKMSRLTRLDLHQTDITDAGLARMVGLGELRSLNLHSTGVTDAAVASLSKLGKLERVYLWNSKVTPAGLAELRRALPRAEISYRLVLPEPSPAADSDRRRRRK